MSYDIRQDSATEQIVTSVAPNDASSDVSTAQGEFVIAQAAQKQELFVTRKKFWTK